MSIHAVSRISGNNKIAIGLILAAAIIYIAVAIATGQYSQLTFNGVMGLLERLVALGFVAIGQTIVIAGGAIDLSVANMVSVSAVLAAYFMNNDPAAVPQAIAIVLVVAALVGVVNGLLVSYLAVSPLIATLGVSLVLQGVLSVAYSTLQGSVPKSFQQVAYGSIAGVPASVVILAAVALATGLALTYTLAGARLFAVGGNAGAARLAGIRTPRVTISAYAFSGIMCGLAGLYLASRLGVGTPWVGRDGNYDLDSVAAVVIGGTLLAGGRGGIFGTLAGAFLFAVSDSVFNMLQIDPFLSQILRGVIVVVAVGIYTFRSRGETA